MHARPFRSRHVHRAIGITALLILAGCGGNDDVQHFGGSSAPTIAAAHAAVPASSGQPLDVNRNVPGGTLTWHVELDGRIEKNPPNASSRAHHLAMVHRAIDGKAHMMGLLGCGDLASADPAMHPGTKPPPSPLEGLQKELDACGDDEACQRTAAMKMMTSAQGKAAIQAVEDRSRIMLGRLDIWNVSGTCGVRARIDDADDTTRWYEDIGEGYVDKGWETRKTTWKADTTIDCNPQHLEVLTDGPTLILDTQTATCDIKLAALQVPVTPIINGKPQKVAMVAIPALSIASQHAAAEGQPFEGDAALPIAGSKNPPLVAKVHWRFVPDAR